MKTSILIPNAKPSDERRTKHIDIRVTESEFNQLQKDAAACGYSTLANYVRETLLLEEFASRRKVRYTMDSRLAEAESLLKEYRRIGTLYNQVVKALNSVALHSGRNGSAPMDREGIQAALLRLSSSTDKLIEITSGFKEAVSL